MAEGRRNASGVTPKQPEHSGHEPHVQTLAAVIGGEEDRAPAGQHVERVQPVGGLVAEQPGRDAVDQPQAKESGDQDDQRDMQPGVAEPGETRRRGDGETRRDFGVYLSFAKHLRVSVSPCHHVTVSPCHHVTVSPRLRVIRAKSVSCSPAPAPTGGAPRICLRRQESRQCSSQACFITRS